MAHELIRRAEPDAAKRPRVGGEKGGEKGTGRRKGDIHV
jgi:hypothetical protein